MAKVIRTEGTPNPNALKFVLGEPLLASDSRSFTTKEAAEGDVIAKVLFGIEGVSSVFYMQDFITVNKDAERPWREIALKVMELVPTIDTSTLTQAVREAQIAATGGDFDALSPAERLAWINSILDNEIRPALASDGGGLQVRHLEGYRVGIHYQGACGSCPSSTAGTLRYIDMLLKEKVHAQLEVVPV